jgi:hypothetical protein
MHKDKWKMFYLKVYDYPIIKVLFLSLNLPDMGISTKYKLKRVYNGFPEFKPQRK